MEFWETTPYLKWYKSHRKFSLLAHLFIEDFEDNNDIYVGEVTGENIDESNVFDKGMPLRSSFTVKRSSFDNNSHLDFNIFEDFWQIIF